MGAFAPMSQNATSVVNRVLSIFHLIFQFLLLAFDTFILLMLKVYPELLISWH
jgi:hypothetical protein